MLNELSETMIRLYRQLTIGWTETIQYKTEAGRTIRRKVFQDSLITQLTDEVSQPRAPKPSDGSKNANKSTSRMPGNERAMFLCDEIYDTLKEARVTLNQACGYEPNSAYYTLPELAQRVPDQITLRSIVDELHRRARAARILLGYESEKVELANAVCDECGGILVVARDVSSDVICVGDSEIKGCGKRYRRLEFVKLLEGKKYLVDTQTAQLWTGRPAGTLFRWRSERRVTSHGEGRPGQARWDLRELPQAIEGEPLPPAPPLPHRRARE